MLPENLKNIIDYSPDTPITRLDDPWLEQFKVQVYVKRDELIDRRISGNKLRKLKYALIRYQAGDYPGILSFGGVWSNHLHATAAVTERLSIPFVAIVRGYQTSTPTDTLKDIIGSGAMVHYVDRSEYRQLRSAAEQGRLQQQPLLSQWSDYMMIPEGGCSEDALKGVADIIREDKQAFDAIYLACGTGATLAGLCVGLGLNRDTRLIGIAALKAGTSLQENVRRLLATQDTAYTDNWIIDDNYHFGGFAKASPELLEFIADIHQRTGLVTEPVYTGKALYGLYQHIADGLYPAGSQLMLLHTGGLQGLRGFKGKGIDALLVASEAAIPYASV